MFLKMMVRKYWKGNTMSLNSSVYKQLISDLVKHEGLVDKVYLDTEGYPTYGVGHLVTKKEMSKYGTVGTSVSYMHIIDTFLEDLDIAIEETYRVIPYLEELPEDAQTILVNMCFNLGSARLSKFKKMLAALEQRDFDTAADEMIDSRWYQQVKLRAKELVTRMRIVHEEDKWKTYV
jgi:lysozyme